MNMTENIAAILDQATPEEMAYGLEWYATARTFALGLADEFDTDVSTTAGVLAAISPRLHWTLNMAYAHRLFATGDAPLLGLSKAKALRIMSGDAPADVLAAPKGRPNSGQKVRAFYACIAAEQTMAVCIDRHAYDIALGVVGDDESRKALDRNGEYEKVAAAYRAVAADRDLWPYQVQAITWVVWRRLKGIAD